MTRRRVQRGVWREYALKLLDFHTHRLFMHKDGSSFGLITIVDRIVRDADVLYVAERDVDKRLKEQLDDESANARIRAKFAESEKWLIKEPSATMRFYRRVEEHPPMESLKIDEIPVEEVDRLLNND